MSEHYEARRDYYAPPVPNVKPGLGEWRFYRDGVEITLDEYTAAMEAAKQPVRIVDALAAKAREALPDVPVFVHGAPVSELRDAIAIRIDPYDEVGPNSALLRADEVLAMPEMQAVRKALFDMGYVIGMEMHPPIPTARQLRTLLESFKLTPTVAAWVLEGGEQ